MRKLNQSYLDKAIGEKNSKVNIEIERHIGVNSGGAKKEILSHDKTMLEQTISSKDRLSCLYTNATSLNNKIDELLIEIIKYKASVIFVSETWWTDESATIITGFNLFRKDRVHSKGGGVCIYIDETIKSYELKSLSANESFCEEIWCMVEIGSEKILIGCMYRKGSSNESENSSLIESIKVAYELYSKNKCTGIMICGNFNYTSINWAQGYSELKNTNDKQANLFVDCLEDCFLYQNMLNPTFQVKTGIDRNVLALIITENDNRLFNMDHCPPLGNIEHGHHLISFDLWFQKK